MNQYAYRRAARCTGSLNAQVVGEELEKLWETHGQQLMPADVVKAARPKKAVLHPCFEWDNDKAAEEYRLWQARQVIRSVYIIEEDRQAPMFVHVQLEHSQPFYQHKRVIVEQPLQYQAALVEARRRLDSALESFEELRRLAVVDKKGDADLGKLAAISEALMTARAVAVHLQ